MPFPAPELVHPMQFPDGSDNPQMVHLNRVIAHPNIEIGDFTYLNDFDPPPDGNWAARIAPYLYPGAPERLRIGRYGQIAHGARFITASANHPMRGLSTYPFAVFDHAMFAAYRDELTVLPDTVVGHDVWIGHGALVLPGARIGHGAIIGAGAVVAGTVADYAVVAGNPARVIRMRFAPDVVAALLDLAWWDWRPEAVRAAIPALAGADPDRLRALAP